jgi:hypothetical protein
MFHRFVCRVGFLVAVLLFGLKYRVGVAAISPWWREYMVRTSKTKGSIASNHHPREELCHELLPFSPDRTVTYKESFIRGLPPSVPLSPLYHRPDLTNYSLIFI